MQYASIRVRIRATSSSVARGFAARVRSSQPGASVLPAPDVKEPWIDRAASYVGKHWLRLLVIVMGFFVGLPGGSRCMPAWRAAPT